MGWLFLSGDERSDSLTPTALRRLRANEDFFRSPFFGWLPFRAPFATVFRISVTDAERGGQDGRLTGTTFRPIRILRGRARPIASGAALFRIGLARIIRRMALPAVAPTVDGLEGHPPLWLVAVSPLRRMAPSPLLISPAPSRPTANHRAAPRLWATRQCRRRPCPARCRAFRSHPVHCRHTPCGPRDSFCR